MLVKLKTTIVLLFIASLSFGQCPVIDAGTTEAWCHGITDSIIDASASNFDNLIWTNTGDGAFSGGSESTIKPIFTPTINDAGTTVTLTLTATSIACPAGSTSTIDLIIRDVVTPTTLEVDTAGACRDGSNTITYSSLNHINVDSFAWSVTTGSPIAGGGVLDTFITIEFNAVATGTYQPITLKTRDVCFYQQTIPSSNIPSIEIDDVFLNITPNISSLEVCNAVDLAPTISFFSQASSPRFFEWTHTSGTESINSDVMLGLNMTGVTPGVYQDVSFKQWNYCESEEFLLDEYQVLAPISDGEVLVSDSIVCNNNGSLQFTADQFTGASQYNWTVNEGTITEGGALTDTFVVVNFNGVAEGIYNSIAVNPTNICGNYGSTPPNSLIHVYDPITSYTLTPDVFETCKNSDSIVRYNLVGVGTAWKHNWSIGTGTIHSGGADDDDFIEININSIPNGSFTDVHVELFNPCDTIIVSAIALQINDVPTVGSVEPEATKICNDGSNSISFDTKDFLNVDSYLWNPGSEATLSNGNSDTLTLVNFLNVTTGSYSDVSVVASNSCGAGVPVYTSTPIKVENAPITGAVLANLDTICGTASNQVTFTAIGFSNYNTIVWSNQKGTIIPSVDSTIFIVKYNQLDHEDQIKVDVRISNSCGHSAEISVIPPIYVFGKVQIGSLEPENETSCTGTTDTITLTAKGFKNFEHFEWDLPTGTLLEGGTSNDSIAKIEISGLSPSTLSNFRVRALNRCDTSDWIQNNLITIESPIIVGTISPNESNLCEGNTVTYSTNSFVNARSYQWSSISGTVISGGNSLDNFVEINYDNVPAGVLTEVTLTASNSCGEATIVSNSTAVTVLKDPIIGSFSIDRSSVCRLGANSSVTIKAIGFDHGTTFDWSHVGLISESGLDTTSDSIVLSFSNKQIGTYNNIELNVSNNCSSTGIVSIPEITVEAPILSNVLSNQTETEICASPGRSVTYSLLNAENASSFEWSFNAGTLIDLGTSSDASIEISYENDPFGVITNPVYVIPSNACGMADTVFHKPIDVHHVIPQGTVDYNTFVVCSNTNSLRTEDELTIQLKGYNFATSYSWDIPVAETLTTTPIDSSITISFQNLPIGSAEVGNVTLQNACTKVTIPFQPINVISEEITGIPELQAPSTICRGESAVLEVIKIGGSDFSGLRFQWELSNNPGNVNVTFQDGSVFPESVLDTSSTSLGLNFADSTGQIKFKVKALSQCGTFSDLTTVQITVVACPTKENSNIVAQEDHIYADGTSSTIITVYLIDELGDTLGIGGKEVVLQTDAGTVSSAIDNNDGSYTFKLTSSTTVETANITYTVDGNPFDESVNVEFIQIDQEATFTVLYPIPSNFIQVNDTIVTFSDEDGNIVQTLINNSSLPDGFAVDATGVITVSDPTLLINGAYTISVTTEDVNGEITDHQVIINVSTENDTPSQIIEFEPMKSDSLNDDDTLAYTIDLNGISSVILTDGTLPNGVSLESTTGLFYVSNSSSLTSQTSIIEVEITDNWGNIIVRTVNLTILPSDIKSIKVPEAFSPNNDGANDQFVIPNLEQYTNTKLYIFNRWGYRIYETLDYQNDWDGTNAEGKDLPDGNYYFRLIYGFDNKQLEGSIVLMR